MAAKVLLTLPGCTASVCPRLEQNVVASISEADVSEHCCWRRKELAPKVCFVDQARIVRWGLQTSGV